MKDDVAYLIDIVENSRVILERFQTITRAQYDADVVLRMGIAPHRNQEEK